MAALLLSDGRSATAPGKLQLQLELDAAEQSAGQYTGATSWLADGLKIQEDQ